MNSKEDMSDSINIERVLNKDKFDPDVYKSVLCVVCNKIPVKPVQKPSHEGVFYCLHCLENFYKEKNMPKAITIPQALNSCSFLLIKLLA